MNYMHLRYVGENVTLIRFLLISVFCFFSFSSHAEQSSSYEYRRDSDGRITKIVFPVPVRTTVEYKYFGDDHLKCFSNFRYANWMVDPTAKISCYGPSDKYEYEVGVLLELSSAIINIPSLNGLIRNFFSDVVFRAGISDPEKSYLKTMMKLWDRLHFFIQKAESIDGHSASICYVDPVYDEVEEIKARSGEDEAGDFLLRKILEKMSEFSNIRGKEVLRGWVPLDSNQSSYSNLRKIVDAPMCVEHLKGFFRRYLNEKLQDGEVLVPQIDGLGPVPEAFDEVNSDALFTVSMSSILHQFVFYHNTGHERASAQWPEAFDRSKDIKRKEMYLGVSNFSMTHFYPADLKGYRWARYMLHEYGHQLQYRILENYFPTKVNEIAFVLDFLWRFQDDPFLWYFRNYLIANYWLDTRKYLEFAAEMYALDMLVPCLIKSRDPNRTFP